MALPPTLGSPSLGSPSPVGASSPPGTPPVGGAGGATMPTQNRGMQAAGLAKVKQAVRLLEVAIGMLGAETEPGQSVMKAIQSLSKHVPDGAFSPGVESSSLQQSMIQSRQDQPMIATLRALGQGPGSGPPGAAMGGASRAA